MKKLVAVSDVVIANLPYEDLRKMGIDYDTISAINPRIILATNSTFGSEGPYATRVGFDTIGQAMSGAMHLSGDGTVPTRANAPYVDFGSALLSTVGVMAALMDRAKSGKGQKVETALLRTAINITNSHLIEQAMLGLGRTATLNRGFTAGPSDTFKCKDGWIYAMTIGQPLFVRWCRLMGNEDLTADPRFKDDLARGDNGEALSAIMQKWCDARTVAEALELLEANRIPAGAVYTPQQTLDDRHVQEAGFFHSMDFPGAAKPIPVLQEPVKLSRTPLTIRSRAPKLGEHTDQILAELGYPPEAIEKLRAERVVYESARSFRGPAAPAGRRQRPGPPWPLADGRLQDRCGQRTILPVHARRSPRRARPWRPPDALDGLHLPRHRRGLDQLLAAHPRSRLA